MPSKTDLRAGRLPFQHQQHAADVRRAVWHIGAADRWPERTNRVTILQLRRPRDAQGRHPVIDLILDQRQLRKLLNTYVGALPQMVNRPPAACISSFNQAGSETGRISNNPNLQNIPHPQRGWARDPARLSRLQQQTAGC